MQRSDKHAKLLQYADRVWQIEGGSEAERIDAAIQRTAQFFESLGIPTHLSAYGLGAEAVDTVLAQLEAHGMTALGEHQNITLATSRTILQGAL